MARLRQIVFTALFFLSVYVTYTCMYVYYPLLRGSTSTLSSTLVKSISDNNPSKESNPCMCVIAIDSFPEPEGSKVESDNGELSTTIHDHDEDEFVCEVEGGQTVPLGGSHNQMNELRDMLHHSKFISA